jgi:hypothetical protein
MPLAGRPAALVLVATLLSAAACTESTGPRGSLTHAELTSLASLMGAHFASSVSSSAASLGGSVAGASVVTPPFNVRLRADAVPCPRGGSTGVDVSVSWVIENAGQSLTADAQGTHTPRRCGFEVEEETIWVSGVVTTTAHVRVVNGFPDGEQRATLDGEDITWETSDGRSGTCRRINYSATANYTTNQAQVNGHFCGADISVSGPLTTR